MATVASPGTRQRQHDVQKHAQAIGAVHQRRVFQFVRYRHEEAAQEEDAECQGSADVNEYQSQAAVQDA